MGEMGWERGWIEPGKGVGSVERGTCQILIKPDLPRFVKHGFASEILLVHVQVDPPGTKGLNLGQGKNGPLSPGMSKHFGRKVTSSL